MDSSRVSTFLISILLIVYGSFRSLNVEQEARERQKEKERNKQLLGLTTGQPVSEGNKFNQFLFDSKLVFYFNLYCFFFALNWCFLMLQVYRHWIPFRRYVCPWVHLCHS